MGHHHQPRALAVGIAVWCLLLLAASAFLAFIVAPYLLDGTRLAVLGPMLRQSYSLFCHQLPERSFHIHGHQLVACARCTGIAVGAFLGLCVALAAIPVGSMRCPPRWVFVLALAPMFLDAGLAMVGLWTATLESRALTGFLAGFGVAHFVLPAMTEAAFDLFGNQSSKTKASTGRRDVDRESAQLTGEVRKEEECPHESEACSSAASSEACSAPYRS